MPNVYVDHCIIQYLLRGFPMGRSTEAERASFQRLRERCDVGMVASEWHLIEAAAYRDNAQAMEYVQYIELWPPVWIKVATVIQRAELQRFLFRVENVDPAALEIVPFCRVYSQLYADDPATAGQIPVGMTARLWVDMHQRDPRRLSELQLAASQTVDALTTGQRARAEGRLRAFEPLVNDSYYSGLLPDRNSSGRLARTDQKQTWLTRCLEAHAELFDTCPAIHTEHVLSTFRIRDPNRRPQVADATDLQHLIAPLAYCDAFITSDRYMLAAARDVRARIAPSAQVFGSIEDAERAMFR